MPCAAPAPRHLFLAALAACAAANAEEPAVYIVGSRLPASEPGLAQQARLLTRADIAPRASVAEALRHAPELHIDQPGAPAGFASVYLRGADPNHAVFLIDGVRVSDPTSPRGGGFDLSSLDPAALERVEILPGASSAVYGAEAMSGVVNVLTRRPRGEGPGASTGLGGLGYRRAAAWVESERVRAGVTAMEDGGESDLGFKRIRSASLRFHVATLMAWRHESRAFPEDSGGPRFAQLRELEQRESDTLLASLGHRWRRLVWQAGILSQDADTDSPGVAPGVRDPMGLPRTLSSTRFTRWHTSLAAQFDHAVLGAEYQSEDGESASTLFFPGLELPAGFSLERATRSLFAEGRVELLPRLSGQAGVRLDEVGRLAARTSAQAGVRYVWRGGENLGLRVGTGFKPPSFFALGHPLVGNPDLRPEESASAELSLASREEASARHRVSLFRSRYRDLVDFDAGPPPRLVNRSRVEIDGVEYALSAKLAPGVTLGGGFTSLSIELPEGAGPLRSRPRNKASATLSAPFGGSGTLKLVATRIGRVFDSSIPTGGRHLDPYFVVDAAVTFLGEAGQLTVAVDNLLDRDYEQFIGFPGIGRRLRIQSSYTFL